MFAYFLKRLLLVLPSLWFISLLIFFLSKLASGDPLLNELEAKAERLSSDELFFQWEKTAELKKELGLQQADFYFSILRKTACDTAYLLPDKNIEGLLESLSYYSGSWLKAHTFFHEFKRAYHQSPADRSKLRQLINAQNSQDFFTQANTLKLDESGKKLQESIAALHQQEKWNRWLPKFRWHGYNNQYHHWLMQLLKGNLGKSYVDRRTVSSKIYDAIGWTLVLSCLSILLAFAIAIPSAVYAASNANSRGDRFLSNFFFGLYALPSFWVATLAIVFLSSGNYLSWFPTYGTGQINDSMNWLEVIYLRSSHLFLPVLCLSYSSIAFIFKQLRNALLLQLKSDYALTALAKGLSPREVMWKHVFKNASFPLLTIAGNLLPALISGSFVIEFIFSIPGMGKLTIDSFLSRDYPVIFSLCLLATFLTILGILLSDLAYHLLDPRVNRKVSQNTQA
jgi:peptide/nickel transport system permease protein